MGVRVPAALIAEIDAFAISHGISRSETVRQALLAIVKLGGFAPEEPVKSPPTPKAVRVEAKADEPMRFPTAAPGSRLKNR